ncbi:hypothetical protein AB1Y20_003447 [Prymnesium parvum]|uniref:NADH dehydrogenase [ubiquinone] 1 beta subcomplex subunit 7 n=1 Tax=Prymnesium parvum TaxID=97485 RepID=A0AB34JEK0_PRYPA
MAEARGVFPLKEKPLAELIAMREAYETDQANAGIPPAPEIKVTREEMKAARIPLVFRDSCAHILIPLNQCRKQTWYSPFKCTDLRHSYEKCQYDEYMRRVAIYEAQKREAKEE